MSTGIRVVLNTPGSWAHGKTGELLRTSGRWGTTPVADVARDGMVADDNPLICCIPGVLHVTDLGPAWGDPS